MAVARSTSEPALGRRITARNAAEARMLRVLDHQWERKASWLHAQQQRLEVAGTGDAATPKAGVIHKDLARTRMCRSDSRLAMSRPLSSITTRNVTRNPQVESVSPNFFGQRPQSATVRSPSDGSPAKLEERIQKAVSKIAQGLHVALLGASASEMHKRELEGEPLRKILREPSEEDACRIFRHFLRLKEQEADRAAAKLQMRRQRLLEWGKEPDRDDPRIPDPLSRLAWTSFFRWVEQESTLGVNPESRRAYAGLFRGARLWFRKCASMAQRNDGLSLGLLLSLAYPTASSRVVAELLVWIGAHELEPRQVWGNAFVEEGRQPRM